MFLIQEKKINFLYIKLNMSCVRSAPHPLYSASCRCSSHAVASASHHLPLTTTQHPSIQPFQSGLQSLVAPVLSPPAVCFGPFHSLFQSLAAMGADSPRIPPKTPSPSLFPSHKQRHGRWHSKKPSAWCVWELLPCSINFWSRNE